MCASALVVRDGRILLLRRGPAAPFAVGEWCCPTGGAEPGDKSLEATAARELEEETGLRATSSRIVGWRDGLGFERPFVGFLVACEAEGLPEVRDPSSDELGWFRAEDLPASTWDRDLLAAHLVALAAEAAAREDTRSILAQIARTCPPEETRRRCAAARAYCEWIGKPPAERGPAPTLREVLP